MGLKQLVKAEKEQFHCIGHKATSIIALSKSVMILRFTLRLKK